MVGLVLVSHSRRLAEAAAGLASGVARDRLPIAFAGGAGGGYDDLGTDAVDVMEAIRAVDGGAGVVILADLGSAILSARLAVEMLGDEVSGARLCPAPLVEGAVTAAVQIAAGMTAAEVCREAAQSLAAKCADMECGPGHAGTVATPAAVGVDSVPGDALRFRFTITDANGLHARPAAAVVRSLSGFEAEARIRADGSGSLVNAKSVNSLALAGVRRGDAAEIVLWGRQAGEALDSFKSALSEGIGVAEIDAPAARADVRPAEPVVLSPGIAIGRLYRADASPASTEAAAVSDAEEEVRRFDSAVAKVVERLAASETGSASATAASAIFGAQALMLADEEVLGRVRAAIRRQSLAAAGVFRREMEALADRYRSLPEPYMRERAADVRGVAERVLEALGESPFPEPGGMEDVVVWSDEASPADFGRWRPEQLRGLLTRKGGPISHAAILARALGIPALGGYVPPPEARTGDLVILDADGRKVAVNPAEAPLAAARARLRDQAEAAKTDRAAADGEAVTRDGTRVVVEANVGDEATAAAASAGGAEGIGLLRTEFLYLGRREPPTEDEQTATLRALFARFSGKPVTVRLLDAGGDKRMPWFDSPLETNPFLGVRGVRLLLERPETLKSQMRAILRAAAGQDVRIMVPLVTISREVDLVRSCLGECRRELAAEGRPSPALPIGIMVETPAAVFQVDRLAESADFFSIGTNDLVQYVMSADRGDGRLSDYLDPMTPAILRAIASVVAGAAERGREVAVCGEMAGEPVCARALVGLGVRILSVGPAAIGRIKRVIRGMSASADAELAELAARQNSARDARALFE